MPPRKPRRTPYAHRVRTTHPRYKGTGYDRGHGEAPPPPPRRDSLSKWGAESSTREGVTKSNHAWNVDDHMKPQEKHTFEDPNTEWKLLDNRRDVTWVDHPQGNIHIIKMLEADLKREQAKLKKALRDQRIAERQKNPSQAVKARLSQAEAEETEARNQISSIKAEMTSRKTKGNQLSTSKVKKGYDKSQLVGHHSQATAYIIEDYPYGRRRTQMRIWIETSPKFGDRVVKQTLNPSTKKWNNPKKSTYSPVIILVKEKQKDGRFFVVPKHIAGGYDQSIEDLVAVKRKYKLTENQEDSVNAVIVAKNAQKYVKYTIKESEPIDLFGDPKAREKLQKLIDEDEGRAEREKEVLKGAHDLSYREMKATGKLE